jgi:tRNA pseudouridine55 synthase
MTANNGLLLVDKPKGLTSHDVVARVRRILHERRVGHAGTLDPMATGLLIIGVGSATRLLRFAQAEVKHYSGEVTFGIATDSLDADGAVVDRRAVPTLTTDDVNRAAQAMLGDQLQTPPMVSAIKVDGQRLHALARQGVEVERTPRSISVSAFSLAPTSDPHRWTFEVTCSVGTYVRVLLSDLSEQLGSIGHLSALRREASGSHRVEEAWTLEDLAAAVEAGESVLLPPKAFTASLEEVVLSDEQVLAMRQGKQLDLNGSFNSAEIAAIDEHAALVGILRPRGSRWQPELVINSGEGR